MAACGVPSRFPHYVYEHFDPDTGECVYVGSGASDRAWRVSRQIAHATWIGRLLSQGLTPDQFVRVLKRDLSKKTAVELERRLIAKRQPRFNCVGVVCHYDRLTGQGLGGGIAYPPLSKSTRP